MITPLDLLIVAAVFGLAFWGWRAGGAIATTAGLELLACLAVAVVFHETLAGLLHSITVTAFGDTVSSGWSVLLAFAILAWGSFAILRTQCHRRPADDDDDETDEDPLLDRLVGAVAGAVGGIVLVGGVLVTLSMVPFLAGLKPSGDRLVLDAGKFVLRAMGQFVHERHEGWPLPLWGEPPSRSAVASARLTSEPWFDADDDGSCTDADRHRDVDGNGTFSKDLYYTDVDGDGMRRIGMIDKYVAARWDAGLMSDDRPRPDAPKPAQPPGPAPPPAKPAQPPAKPAQPQKPDGRKPAAPPAADEKQVEDDF
jgi:hypothetical protein